MLGITVRASVRRVSTPQILGLVDPVHASACDRLREPRLLPTRTRGSGRGRGALTMTQDHEAASGCPFSGGTAGHGMARRGFLAGAMTTAMATAMVPAAGWLGPGFRRGWKGCPGCTG